MSTFKKAIFFIAIFGIFESVCFAQQLKQVKVQNGIVEGSYEDGLLVFRGVPFAAPPIGELRWRAPSTTH